MAAAPYPRELAVRILTRVLSDHEHLDDALAAAFAGAGQATSPQSRGWLQEACSGTLRWKGRLDQVIDSAALKKKPSGWLRKMLLVAAYQLVVQERTQPSAVVFETVEAIKRKEGEAPARFANALLRKIADHAREWRELPFPAKKEAAPQWASLPDWLWERLVKSQGLEWASAFARASLERPELWIRVKEGSEAPAGGQPGPVPGSFKFSEGGRISEVAGFSEGTFFVQDISSQQLVHEVSSYVLKTLGRERPHALDVCAAPGGKSAGLAWNGFVVTASDRDAVRTALLRDTLVRVAPDAKVVSTAELPAEQDLVWVDAPCSGTGILRRHPDVRWLRREKEIPGLLKAQEELLRTAWEKVRPGGFLAYSVCSVLDEEGPGALERTGLAGNVVQEWRLAPHLPPAGDGFFAALLRKS